MTTDSHSDRKHPMKRITIVLLLAFGLALATNASANASAPSKPTIHFVGDSITWGATADTASYFHYQLGFTVTVSAIRGQDTLTMGKYVYADALAHPTVEVINLGTNDAWRVENGTYKLNDVLHRLDVFASHALFPRTCVVVTTINTHGFAPATAALINAWIRSHFPHVADWDAAYNPAYFDAVGNPHPNELGRHALIHVQGDAVEKCGR